VLELPLRECSLEYISRVDVVDGVDKMFVRSKLHKHLISCE